VMNKRARNTYFPANLRAAGEGSAAAGPVGRHASMGTDWKMSAELLTYSRSKGAFAGLTLEGAVVDWERRFDRGHIRQGHTVPQSTDWKGHRACRGGNIHGST
jgi:lipid-binding SYLF domain-containing protein